jgi:hypothetical protein
MINVGNAFFLQQLNKTNQLMKIIRSNNYFHLFYSIVINTLPTLIVLALEGSIPGGNSYNGQF